MSARGVLRASFVIWCLLLAPALAQEEAPASGSSWPQFRANPRLTGVSTSVPPPTLKLLWQIELGDSINGIDSSAAIVDGTVYVGALTGELSAVDLGTGKLRWKYSTGQSIGESSPAVAGGIVYVGDSGGVLHAVRAQDGKGVWTFKTGQEIKSSPVVTGRLVLVGSYDGSLYALDAATGKQRWKFDTEGQPVHATPAVHLGMAFIAGCDEVFRAVSLADGKEVFQIRAGANTAASPVLDGDRAYFGTFSNEVLAFDLKSRKVVWRYENPERQFPFYSSAALMDGKVIIGSRDKLVHAIDTATGKKAWTFTTGARVDSSPAVAGGRAYVGSSDGRLYVLDAANGSKLWEFNTGAAITASPAIAEGRVVVASTDGVLYCFG
jgi:outer membrane protein assembly factor BamB